MSPRNESFVRSNNVAGVATARRSRYADACLASLRWLRDAFALLATATLLAWLVVRLPR